MENHHELGTQTMKTPICPTQNKLLFTLVAYLQLDTKNTDGEDKTQRGPV
jgi:hypothetical protein